MSNYTSKSILFIIFSPLFTKGGHSKNFLNLIKNLSNNFLDNNVDTIIISFNNSKEEIRENKNKILDNSYFKAYKVDFIARFFPAGRTLYQFFEFFMNLVRTIRIFIKYNPSLIYCYGDIPLLLTFFWKRLFSYKLIFDMRGDIINEWKVKGKSRIKLLLFMKLYHFARSRTDLIFSVSSTFPKQGKKRVYPKYNYFDCDVFNYDEKQAKLNRQKMGLENNFIFVYTGNVHYYQMIEENIRFFIQFYNKYNDSFLIIITEYEQDKFINSLKESKIPKSSYMIKSLPQEEIAGLQSIANIGLMLRDDLPLNHHSFPTKFTEYLASGVPVLMTPHIHTIAPLVLENKLGEVIQLKNNYSNDIENIYNFFNNNYEIKRKCSNYAREHFMWQRKAKDIFQIIDKI